MMKRTRRSYEFCKFRQDGWTRYHGRTSYMAARCAEYLVNAPNAEPLIVTAIGKRVANCFLILVETILKQDLDVCDDAIRREEGRIVVHRAMGDDRVLYIRTNFDMHQPFVVEPWIFDIPVEDMFEVVVPRLAQNEKASQ